jgi:hypothetical protein
MPSDKKKITKEMLLKAAECKSTIVVLIAWTWKAILATDKASFSCSII